MQEPGRFRLHITAQAQEMPEEVHLHTAATRVEATQCLLAEALKAAGVVHHIPEVPTDHTAEDPHLHTAADHHTPEEVIPVEAAVLPAVHQDHPAVHRPVQGGNCKN